MFCVYPAIRIFNWGDNMSAVSTEELTLVQLYTAKITSSDKASFLRRVKAEIVNGRTSVEDALVLAEAVLPFSTYLAPRVARQELLTTMTRHTDDPSILRGISKIVDEEKITLVTAKTDELNLLAPAVAKTRKLLTTRLEQLGLK